MVEEVSIPFREGCLPGTLTLPAGSLGVVIFAHGSGSSRFSPRNIEVARSLNQAGIGTLLFDLLTESESLDRENVFDIPLLAERLSIATRWLSVHLKTIGQSLPIGYFGASTGGGAALWAASDPDLSIRAVVSRGGRPDLAKPKLKKVIAPTLLIVGGNDEPVIELNQLAMHDLKNANLVIVPGATHLFEEPGKLETVSRFAIRWFDRWFAGESHELTETA